MQAPERKAEKGAPPWVMTFADLMSLLLCFFVLLLSFSEMDVAKYKELAGSLKFAFGVQRDIKVKEPPKGINVIAREFSPGRPEPTPFNVIRQITTQDLNVNLDLGRLRHRPEPSEKNDRRTNPKQETSQKLRTVELTEAEREELRKAKQLAARRLDEKLKAERQLAALKEVAKKDLSIDDESLEERIKAKVAADRARKLEKSAKLISNALGREIEAGSVDVETEGQKIIIRVREKASFASGRANLKDDFRPLLGRVAKILKGSEGKIIVAGHTDNVPIYTQRFRSNWELSSARAVSVAHEMMLATDIPSARFLIQGFADTQPVAPNNDAASRARNRRVEIILQQGEDKEAGDLDTGGLQQRSR
jgi:chemotaxis protein MotB